MEHEHDQHTEHHMVRAKSSPVEYAKLAAVLGVVTLLAIFFNGGGGLDSFLRWFMGLFFLTFGSFKLIGYEMFTVMFAGYDLLAQRWKPWAYLYPFVELALAVLYLADWWGIARDLLTLAIMGYGAKGVWIEIKQRRSGVYCACLGNVIKLPLSTVSLLEDVGMGAMALVMIFL